MRLYAFQSHNTTTKLKLPLYLNKIPAGFPSPADDYMDKRLDLNEYLITNDAATFYCRVSGDSMREVGISSGDLLIVDRSRTPQNGSVVVANVDGEFTCKILDTHNRRLIAANPIYKPIPILESMEMVIEGIVIHSIRSHSPYVRSR